MGSRMEHRELRQVPPPPPDDGRDAEESKLILDAVQDVLAEQRDSAERLRSAARQTFVFVSVLFTVAQTAAFTSFGEKEITDAEQTYMLLCGVAAALGVGITGWLTRRGDNLQTADAVAVSDIAREVDRHEDEGAPVSEALIKLYNKAIDAQKPVITGRRRNSDFIAAAVFFTVFFVLAEIAVAFIARIP